jgi:hypothetical protein
MSFFSQNNQNILWEIVSEEYQLTNNTNISKTKTQEIYSKGIYDIFTTQFNEFKKQLHNYPQHSLIVINKAFLKQLNKTIHKLFPNINEDLNREIKPIKIIDDETIQPSLYIESEIQPILHDDIQRKKQVEFNHLLERHQSDLNVSMGITKPIHIDLSDKQTELEDKDPETIRDKFAKTLAERNYDPVPRNSQNINPTTKTRQIEKKNEKNISWDKPVQTVHYLPESNSDTTETVIHLLQTVLHELAELKKQMYKLQKEKETLDIVDCEKIKISGLN